MTMHDIIFTFLEKFYLVFVTHLDHKQDRYNEWMVRRRIECGR